MGTQLEQAPAVREFATAIGEWLLTQRFGTITPLAFRYRVWEPRDPVPGEMPHVVIELLVNDPSSPPPEWLRLSEEERRERPVREWAQALLWPRADRDAVREAAEARARSLCIPDGIASYWPVEVDLFARSEAGECGFPPVGGEPTGRPVARMR